MITLDIAQFDQTFIQFYQEHPYLSAMDLATRIMTIAEYFLDRPYQFEPLGEGADGKYSTLPLYRADQFDCVTFADTLLALVHATDFTQFKQRMIKIRYRHHQINYTQRTDWFTDFEWNPHLQQLGYLQDVTFSFVDQDNKSVAVKTTTIIDKPHYYAQKTLADLKVPNLSQSEAQQLLTELRAEGKKFTAQSSELDYIPFTELFDREGERQAALWQQFPAVSVVEIVRPNWRPVNPKDKQTDYGTNLNVSHLGIAIHTDNEVIFYHAATGKSVIKLPLVDYLRAFLHDERPAPISGIHIEKIL